MSPEARDVKGVTLAACSCVLYCLNGELLQALQKGGERTSPLLNLLLCHLGGLVFVPRFGSQEAFLKRSSKGFISPRISSLLFALLLMSYNYAWLLSASYVDLSLTNAIFQVSVALVYLCSVRLFAEALSLDRLVGVSLSLLGSFMAAGVGAGGTAASTILGTLLALLAAGGYTAYQVLFRWSFGHLKSNVAFLAHFGAWISIWHLLVILPLICAAHLLGLERFELPAEPLILLGTLVSALLAFSVNALYLCIVMWGSPMLLPSTSVLSVPLTVVLDITLHRAEPGSVELLGQVLVLISVVLIMQLHRLVPRTRRKYELMSL